jgi:hypothetical protein
MADPLVVLVFVLATGKTAPTTPSMTAAARLALGSTAVILFEERPVLPPEDEALAVAEHVRANAVVELDWEGSEKTSAIVRVHAATRAGWMRREIDFDSGEAPGECGRTVGFAIASMVTERAEESSAPPDVSPPEAVSQDTSLKTPQTPTLVSPAADDRPIRPSQPTATPRWGIEAAASGTVGAEASDSLGGVMSAYTAVLPWLALQVDGGMRFGSVPAAQSSYRSLQLGGGAMWRTLSPTGGRPIELDLRVDLFANEVAVFHGTQSQSRWLPGGSASFEGVWFIGGQNIGVLLAIGVDASFGTTALAVGSDTVATIPPLRALGALGARVRF